MSARTAEPLPECFSCERPTRREVFAANKGLCTECAAGLVLARQARFVARRRRSV